MSLEFGPDYKTDYIPAGRSWTLLDAASPKTANSRATQTTLDDPGQCAEGSKTAGCRFDSCPTGPEVLNSSGLRLYCMHPVLDALTPVDPRRDKNRSLTTYARLVINVLVQHKPRRSSPKQ